MKPTTLTLLLLLPLGLSAQFNFETRITNSAGNAYTSFNNANAIAAYGNVVHLVYTDDRGLEDEVYYQRSIDGGTTWQMPVPLTGDNGSFSGYPTIAVWNDVVHVAWADQRGGHDDIYYRKSVDGGNSWFDEERITSDPNDSNFPCLSTSGPIVHLVWTDNRFEGEEVYYCHSLNAGLSWGDQIRLTKDDGNSINGSVTSSSNDVHVVWQDNRNGNDEIYYKRSTDGGLTWGEDLRMTNNPLKSNFPSVVAEGKTIIVVWSDLKEGNAEIFGLRSVDSGDTWSEEIRLTNSPRESLMPKIAMEGAFAFVTWHELHDGFANWEVESRFSTDGGFNWTPRRQISVQDWFSGNSTVCIENALVVVAYTDNRYGDSEILCRRNLLANPLHSTHTLDWAYNIGAAGSSTATGMVVDADGNIFLTGNFQNSVDFDPGMEEHSLSSAGGDDIFISKTSPSGRVLWTRRIGGPGADHANSIAMDREGNVIVTGSFHGTVDFDPGPNLFSLSAGVNGDGYITKLDENGEFLWAMQITGDGFNEILSVKTDAANSIFVTGLFEGTADFDPTDGVPPIVSSGLADVFLAKYTSEGQLIWVHGIGGSGSDVGRGLTVTNTGNVWVAGHFSENVDFNPKPDDATLTAHGLEDIFVATYTGQGDYIRALRIGGNENDEVNGIHMDASGDILLTGTFRGNVDFNPNTFTSFLASKGGDDGFVVKLSSSGAFIWARSFGGVDNDQGIAISADKNDNILVTGYFTGYADFYTGNTEDSWAQATGDEDLFVLTLKSNGDFGKMDQISGAGSDVASAIAHYESTRYYIAGSFTQTIDADPSSDYFGLSSNGDDDFFLASINICPAVYSFIEATACDSMLSPDGELVWTSTGTYLDTLSSTSGCDSIVTVLLTINVHDEIDVIATSCDSYTTPSGQHTWTQSGEYMESFTNTDGCDSLIFYQLTIYHSSETTDTRTECSQYEDPLGNIYTTSGFYIYSIPDVHGCDSVISLELTIVQPSETERTETSCDSLVTPGGVLTVSGVYTQVFTATNGCDSIVTLHLTIINSTSGSEVVETCFSYTTPVGETLDDSGTYTYVLPNAAGCDSVITLNLMIVGPDNSLMLSDNYISAQQDSAAYQWMDCTSNMLIPDAVEQSYFPAGNGTFAVIVTLNGCVDTSACIELIIVSSDEPDSQSDIKLYPNPTEGDILIELSALRENVQMEITDVYGRKLEVIKYQQVRSIPFTLHYPPGTYLFYILADGQRRVVQVVKM